MSAIADKIEVAREVKRSTAANKFVYEGNYYHDYFRAIPFVRMKKMLDKRGMSLDGKTVLIAGCGCGIDAHYLTKFYCPKKVYLADIHMQEVYKALSNYDKKLFILADNENLSFRNDAFDFVFIAASLHHLKEPLRGLYELLRAAKYGLIVIEPNDCWLTRLFEKLGLAQEYEAEHKNYVYRFSRRDVVKIGKAAFLKHRTTSFFAIHRVARSEAEFLTLKILNGLANIICPGLGNYIVFMLYGKNEVENCPRRWHP